MFAPISARFASSCSRKGIRPAAIEITCIGLTSIRSISSGAAVMNSPRRRTFTMGFTKRPSGVSGALAWAMTCFSSSSASM